MFLPLFGSREVALSRLTMGTLVLLRAIWAIVIADRCPPRLIGRNRVNRGAVIGDEDLPAGLPLCGAGILADEMLTAKIPMELWEYIRSTASFGGFEVLRRITQGVPSIIGVYSADSSPSELLEDCHFRVSHCTAPSSSTRALAHAKVSSSPCDEGEQIRVDLVLMSRAQAVEAPW